MIHTARREPRLAAEMQDKCQPLLLKCPNGRHRARLLLYRFITTWFLEAFKYRFLSSMI